MRKYNGRYLVQYDLEAIHIINTIHQEDGILLTELERRYVNHIVSGLKSIGVWDKIKALYGFVGGTAATHRWNWKDMRDLNAAYRMTFINTSDITHNSQGVSFGGNNGYADSNLIPNSVFSVNNVNIMAYVVSSVSNEGGDFMICANQNSGTAPSLALANRLGGSSTLKWFRAGSAFNNDAVTASSADLYTGCVSGNSLSNINAYWNNGRNVTSTISSTGSTSLPTQSLLLMANRTTGVLQPTFDGKLLSCVIFSEGLTDLQIIVRDNIITTAQKILNRA